MDIMEKINQAQKDYKFFYNMLKKLERIENKTEGNKYAMKQCEDMLSNLNQFFENVDYTTQITYD